MRELVATRTQPAALGADKRRMGLSPRRGMLNRLLPGALALGVVVLAATWTVAFSARAGGKNIDGVVNLNTAPFELLSLLPGIGPSKARGVLSYRTRHPFRTVDELVRVKGIGRRMVRDMRPHLAVAGPSTAHGVAGARNLDVPPTVPVPPPPRLACRPTVAVPARNLSLRLTRAPQPRPVRSAANHCAPPV